MFYILGFRFVFFDKRVEERVRELLLLVLVEGFFLTRLDELEKGIIFLLRNLKLFYIMVKYYTKLRFIIDLGVFYILGKVGLVETSIVFFWSFFLFYANGDFFSWRFFTFFLLY